MKERDQIIKRIFKRIYGSKKHILPAYFITLQYGFYGDDGNRIPVEEMRKYWDKTEVKKTVRLVRNLLREYLGISRFYAFMERHKGVEDMFGEQVKLGRFHNHIITSTIDNIVLASPNRKVRMLLSSLGWLDMPLEDVPGLSLDDCKIKLLEACIRKANWVNRYSHSIKIEVISTPDDLKRVVEYCLKDYNPKSGLDFTDIADFDNSDFYLE